MAGGHSSTHHINRGLSGGPHQQVGGPLWRAGELVSARSWVSLTPPPQHTIPKVMGGGEVPPAVKGCPEGMPAGTGLGVPAALGPYEGKEGRGSREEERGVGMREKRNIG